MAATAPAIGYGSTFASGDGGDPEVFTDWGHVRVMNGPEIVKDTHDATHMGSANRYREFVVGLLDAGEVTVEMFFLPGGATEALIKAQLALTTPKNYVITSPDNTDYGFSGYCTQRGPSIQLDDLMSITATFKVTGRPIFMA